MRSAKICLAAGLACAALGVAAQAAPGEVFLMQIPNIVGGVSRPSYTGWIAVNAFSAGISDNAVTNVGSGAARVTCDPLVVIKPLDTVSPELALDAGTGQHLSTVTLVALSGGGESHEFLRFTLRNALVSSIHFGGDSVSSSRTETVSIVAQQIQITATPQLENGAAGNPVTTNISCAGG